MPTVYNLRHHGTLLGSRNGKTGLSLVKSKLDREPGVDLSANPCFSLLPFSLSLSLYIIYL